MKVLVGASFVVAEGLHEVAEGRREDEGREGWYEGWIGCKT